MVDGAFPVTDLRDTLRAMPCGAALLDAAPPGGGVHLVGGAVRDLLRGVTPAELDVAVEGDTTALLTALGGLPLRHERFGTATVQSGACRIDVAMTRAERYASPGALPEVRPAGLAEDLGRRDFTVNAIALDLGDGRLREAPGAQDDLRAGLLRVLHDRSFVDDPTRLWRLARYRARLGFEVEPSTRELAREAVAAGALATVSSTRIGNELRLALAEPDPVAALESAAELGPGALAGGRPRGGRAGARRARRRRRPGAHRAGDRRTRRARRRAHGGLEADAGRRGGAARGRSRRRAAVGRGPRVRHRPGRGGRGDRDARGAALARAGPPSPARDHRRGPHRRRGAARSRARRPPAGGPRRGARRPGRRRPPRTSSPSP